MEVAGKQRMKDEKTMMTNETKKKKTQKEIGRKRLVLTEFHCCCLELLASVLQTH
jgi:hypothetical protein